MIKREWWEIVETRLSIECDYYFSLCDMGFGSDNRFEAAKFVKMMEQKSKTYKSFLSKINSASKEPWFQDLVPYVREIVQDVDRAIKFQEVML